MHNIIDVTNVILAEDKLVMALFDGRYDALALIRIATHHQTGEPILELVNPIPDVDRIYWLDKFGLMSEDEIAAESERLKMNPNMRRALYEILKRDYEEVV